MTLFSWWYNLAIILRGYCVRGGISETTQSSGFCWPNNRFFCKKLSGANTVSLAIPTTQFPFDQNHNRIFHWPNNSVQPELDFQMTRIIRSNPKRKINTLTNILAGGTDPCLRPRKKINFMILIKVILLFGVLWHRIEPPFASTKVWYINICWEKVIISIPLSHKTSLQIQAKKSYSRQRLAVHPDF